MNITPKSAPTLANSQTPPSSGAMSARDRAIAKLVPAAAPAAVSEAPREAVPNPSNVSPEEMSAVKAPETKVLEAEIERKDISEEAPVEVTKSEEEPLSSQYANLARKEKALRAKAQAQEAALKSREAALQAREEALKPKDVAFDPSKYIPKDQLAKDPFSVLNELGLTYDQLTNLALNAPKPEDVARQQEFESLKNEIKALKDAQEKSSKSQEESQQNAYKQAVAQIRSEATQLVSSNPEFETIKETGSVNDVVELIEQTFKSDGVLLSVEEAAKMVEDYLMEEAMKIMKINKIKNKFQPSPAASANPVKSPVEAPKQPQTMKTLTNNISTSRQLSARERAILAFKGELKE